MIELPPTPSLPFLKRAMAPLWDYLLRSRLTAGRGLSISEHATSGLVIELDDGTGKGGVLSPGNFCKVFRSPAEGENPPKWMLLGGLVSGGEGNITFTEIELATFGEEPEDGVFHWIEVSYTANSEDGFLFSGGNVTGATEGSGAEFPDNTIPTASSPDGTLYVNLGQWMGSRFRPAACGDILISHCPGSLVSSR